MASRDVEVGSQSNRSGKSNEERLRFIIRTIFHIVTLLYKIGVLLYSMVFLAQIFNHEIDKVRELSRYVWGFITNWNMTFQIAFLLLSSVYDVLEWRGLQCGLLGKRLRRWRDIAFTAFVAPFTPFVATFFWGIYWTDKEMIYPSIFDDVAPWWLNHCIHSNILIIYFVEVILVSRRKPVDAKVEHICFITVGVAFTITYYSIHFITGRWLYNLFAFLTWWQIVLLHTFGTVVVYACYRLQFPLNRLFHKKEKELPKDQRMIDVSRWMNGDNKEDGRNGVLHGKEEIPFIDKSSLKE